MSPNIDPEYAAAIQREWTMGEQVKLQQALEQARSAFESRLLTDDVTTEAADTTAIGLVLTGRLEFFAAFIGVMTFVSASRFGKSRSVAQVFKDVAEDPTAHMAELTPYLGAFGVSPKGVVAATGALARVLSKDRLDVFAQSVEWCREKYGDDLEKVLKCLAARPQ